MSQREGRQMSGGAVMADSNRPAGCRVYTERAVTSGSLDALCDAAADCVRDLMREHGPDIEVTDWGHDKDRGVAWASAVVVSQPHGGVSRDAS